MKHCAECHQSKPDDRFSPKQTQCKACRSRKARDKLVKDPDGCRSYQSAYRQKNRKRIRKYARDYDAKCPEKYIWRGMIKRCVNPKEHWFHRYGGRGIKVCSEWMDSFDQFLKDMGPRPTPNHEIDRRDNDGDYEPNNCRWTTRTGNRRNMPGVKLDIHIARDIRSRIKCGEVINHLAKEYGVCWKTIKKIYDNKIWKEGAE